jgi:hypothetical protein
MDIFGLHCFSIFDAHELLFWSFDVLGEFLQIPFATLESLSKSSLIYIVFEP